MSFWIVLTVSFFVTTSCKGNRKNYENSPVIDEPEQPNTASHEDLDEDLRQDKKIFAYYFTTSSTRIVTTTITALSTCLSIIMAPAPPPPPPPPPPPMRSSVIFSRQRRQAACVGRRISTLKKELEDYDVDITDTDSSMHDDEESAGKYMMKPEQNEVRNGRKLTFWTTAFTVITVTSTSAMPGTTVTASLLCRLPGAVNSCFLG
ncbi:hypothetical protein SK128_009748 [Halocaridina rubra]|uniref:Uncharacterized protein n=1 Tax=Halocaridina rubra TaxID=373956 RepID=A0AAN8X664_HALRR